jgi:GNAT superfamily N-acetyltransferase
MLIEAKNKKLVFLRKLESKDFGDLFDYLQDLSAETKKRFGPHEFDQQSIVEFYKLPDIHRGYVALDIETNRIVAYSIIRIGYLGHDKIRLQSYGLTLDNTADCTFAPSVADLWQGCGVGNKLFHFILSDLKINKIRRIILWGGVQVDNDRAVSYYKRNGFKILGQFSHNGENYDMIFDVPTKHSR